jgi:hypothetical protein
MNDDRMVHKPLLEAVMGLKSDDPGEGQPAGHWDGTLRLACSCGWSEPRIFGSSTALAVVWRQHVLADTSQMPLRLDA